MTAGAQALPAWDDLRRAALAALAVFGRQGKLSDDREISWRPMATVGADVQMTIKTSGSSSRIRVSEA